MKKKQIPEDLQIRLESVQWIFKRIEEISRQADCQFLPESKIEKLLNDLDCLETKFEWERKKLLEAGYPLP